MGKETYYSRIMREYPEYISKEQLYKLCCISKRVAKYYLDNGIIPCVDTGKATHKYKVKITDVISFLRKRSESPELFMMSTISVASSGSIRHESLDDEADLRKYRKIITAAAVEYPDLMSTAMVSELTGYSEVTIIRWSESEGLRQFHKGMKILFSRKQVIEFMMGEKFRCIRSKSRTHREYLAFVMCWKYGQNERFSVNSTSETKNK